MNTFWETILISSLGIIGGFLSASLTTYINTKSQYKAMREEIGEITEAVESVKKTFHDDTEKLKSQLSVLTNKHSILFTEEKEALLAYLSAWNIWNSHLEKMVDSFTSKEYKESDECIDEIEKLKAENNKASDKIQICISTLELFMTDMRIISAVYNLNIETYQLQVLNEKYIELHMDYTFTLEYYMNEYNLAEEEKDEDAKKEWMKTIMELTEEKKSEHNEYNTDLLEITEKIVNLKNEFINLSKDYIRKGIEV